ncbi:hypothetical protein RV11_GL000565 [Enterococcus phoeniculicola]|jgi:hypothetical protein|nr:DUF2785 domain-containing protein [Enterococcus phoeniculicola]OJG71275.1 hypothetical protein RV11_GL000565 [Enterococcus phoeniculicola]
MMTTIEIKQILEERLQKEIPFTCSDTELDWLLAHIGDEDATIRDTLVFNALALGIINQGFTKEQFHYLASRVYNEQLLFFQLSKKGKATLTRSFTALLIGFIVQADGDKESIYFSLLSDTLRNYFFTCGITYLSLETDYIGFSLQYGWVHAIAHGADLLKKSSLHPSFPNNYYPDILSAISHVFHMMDAPFVDGEERRLATIIYSLLLVNKMDELLFINWLDTLIFPKTSPLDYQRLSCFENFLAAIYFHLEEQDMLSPRFKKFLLEKLKDY